MGQTVVIGNTATPEGPLSEFTLDEWRRFLAGAKQGDFDGVAGTDDRVTADAPYRLEFG